MIACLNCKNYFEPKRPHAKFCSDKCRVAWNRANPQGKVTKLQMQSLYNAVLETLDKIQFVGPQKEYDAPKLPPTIQDEPFKPVKQIPKAAVDAIGRKYLEDRRDCNTEEEFMHWLERLGNDDRLTGKQKEEIKNTR